MPAEAAPAGRPGAEPAGAPAPLGDAALDRPRAYVRSRFAWIVPEGPPGAEPPREARDGWLGHATYGGAIPLRGPVVGPVPASPACLWQPVEPRGLVCLGRDAALDPDDPVASARRAVAPDLASPFPYAYARSLGAPRYRGIPPEREQRMTERDLDVRRARIASARAAGSPEAVARVDPNLVGVTLEPAGAPAPSDLERIVAGAREGDESYAFGATIAYVSAFDANERSWLLTWDRAVVPRSRVRDFARSTFHGVDLGGDVRLPIAFFRGAPQRAAVYRRDESGAFVATDASFPPHTWIALRGPPVDGRLGGTAPASDAPTHRFHATSRKDAFVDDAEAVVLRGPSTPPALPEGGRRTWIEVSAVGGWLVAYEGERPVFATLISAGRGITIRGTDGPVDLSSTPRGTYAIQAKLATTTMVHGEANEELRAEVPYTQTFRGGGYALHGAYWHDKFGERRSRGCVNLSPIDARRLFELTEPSVPEGWHAVRALPGEPVTMVVIHD